MFLKISPPPRLNPVSAPAWASYKNNSYDIYCTNNTNFDHILRGFVPILRWMVPILRGLVPNLTLRGGVSPILRWFNPILRGFVPTLTLRGCVTVCSRNGFVPKSDS